MKTQQLLIAGGVGALALLFAFSAKAKEAPKAADPEPDPPAPPPPTKADEEAVEREMPMITFAPSKQPVDPPNYGTPPEVYSSEIFQIPQNIREFFWALGYIPDSAVDNTPMNPLGPDGMLGGGDDEANEVVRDFQADYNAVSRRDGLTAEWGTLDEDGLVGPHTLNALLHVREESRLALGAEDDSGLTDWWTDKVAGTLTSPVEG